MAYNTAPGRAEYVATAGQSVFLFVFKIYAAADIKVYLTPLGQTPDDVADLLILTTDYTVVVSGDAGGTITLVVAASAGDKITLVRSLDIDRLIEYQTNGDLLADTLNNDQNYQTYLIADKESDNTRFLKLPESAQGISTAVPPPVPLNFFQWNAAGTAIVNVSSLQADGFIWTAADVYNKTETNALLADKVDTTTLDENAKLWDAQTVTHDFTTDADYTLTSAQNSYGRIVLADTGVVLTTGRNVITDNVEKSFIVQNDTAQTITVKTSVGSGVAIPANGARTLYNDGTNIIDLNGVSVLQEDSFYTGTVATGTAMIPVDDTIPQSSEGTQFMSLSFTPVSENSKLIIEASFFGQLSIDAIASIALFTDLSLDSIAVVAVQPRSTGVFVAPLSAELSTGSISPITITLRAGGQSASTLTLNGVVGVQKYGGAASSYIKVTEVAQ